MPAPAIRSLDHLVLTVADPVATAAWYARVLGFETVHFSGRMAMHFGDQKINLHKAGAEYEPKSRVPTAGSGDLCFLTDTPLAEIAAHFEAEGVAVEDGPVPRTGAAGALMSLYFRDLDGNLLEVSNVV